MTKYRNEWKYILNNKDLSLLRSRISSLLVIDKHTPKEGKYIIHSLYFDDYYDTSLNDTFAHLSKRYKWRIRYYGNDLSYIVLERKEKLEGRCHKESTKLSIEEYKYIINKEYSVISYSDKKLIRELSKDMMIYLYTPKIIIDYERIAYVEEITNIRITFDSKISASYDIDNFLNGNYVKYYLQGKGENLLEVKFDYILPSYIKEVVESYNFKQTSFSKYFLGRNKIDLVMNGGFR